MYNKLHIHVVSSGAGSQNIYTSQYIILNTMNTVGKRIRATLSTVRAFSLLAALNFFVSPYNENDHKGFKYLLKYDMGNTHS